MCRSRISLAILRGFLRIRFGVISLVLLMNLACETKGNGVADIHRIVETGSGHTMRANLGPALERRFFDENIVVGHSGDPWGSHNESEDLRNFHIRFGTPIGRSRRVNRNGRQNFVNRRPRRSVVHLYNMVVCATGCNPMSYKGYGCYCGFLGSGSAVDGIDQCCRMHDRCYDATECPTFLEYFVPYYWKCYRGYRPICAVEHGKWGGSGSCAQRLCECDRALSECLRRFPCPTSKAVCTTSPWRLIQNVFMIF